MLIGTTATGLATAVNVDPNLIGELGRWPATIVLGAIAGLCVWLQYKQAKDFSAAARDSATALRDTAASTNKAIMDLVGELRERPCIRKPVND